MVKTRHRRYPDEDVLAAVEMYLNGPNSLKDTAKVLGMSWSTLLRWVQLHRAAHPEDKR